MPDVSIPRSQLRSVSDDRARLQQQLLHERSAAAAQAEELAALQQRQQISEHRTATVKVVTDSLQVRAYISSDAGEASGLDRGA